MSDKMRPIPFSKLLQWFKSEYQRDGSIFGIRKENFHFSNAEISRTFFGNRCENPIGPAAGPHTQMTQNIAASFLCGARFIELKTVQIIDQLEIAKPCIYVKNEGYNIEWSQELLLDQSFDEYLKAWFLLHLFNCLIFKKSIPGNFIFNMSVGYDLAGIKSESMQKFIYSMMNAQGTKQFDIYKDQIHSFLIELKPGEFNLSQDELNLIISELDSIPSQISNSVTLSTMHGCPPDEIEKIAKYLIGEKRLNTYIKLNPTLLGYDTTKKIISDNGYNHIKISEESFTNDLQFTDAVGIITRLKDFAESNKLEFGIKLSNTLPVVSDGKNLNGKEMYLSGKILFPITINLAAKLVKEIGSNIPVSFSGGADAGNFDKLISCGIMPVTLVTDLLKPGGYARLNQLSKIISQVEIPDNIDQTKLEEIAINSLKSKDCKFDEVVEKGVIVEKPLELFDCFVAPCKTACPIEQDIPEYLRLVEVGKYDEALKVIMDKNPLPNITGYICDHQCQFNCSRIEYDSTVEIREFKKLAAEHSSAKSEESNSNIKNDIKVAVIGAGPSGLAFSYFLAREGFLIDLYEKEKSAGGVVQNLIPQFRIPARIVERDIDFLKEMGVNFFFNSKINSIKKLFDSEYKYCFVGIGAEKSNILNLDSSDKEIKSAVEVLWHLKNNTKELDLEGNIAVIGGGNSAMDCARAVKRVEKVNEVSIIYRRTAELMPADKEEFEGALADGVNFIPLHQPVSFADGTLVCKKTKVGNKFGAERPKIILTENLAELKFDFIISAIGEHADISFYSQNEIILDERHNPIVDERTNETNVENVFLGGDCISGPRTVVEAIADARKASNEILRRENLVMRESVKDLIKMSYPNSFENIYEERGRVLQTTFSSKKSNCLNCDLLCNKCIEVCPNRANIALEIISDQFKDKFQIVHLDALCNECGNCASFCPYDGKPYRDKFTIFREAEDFSNSTNSGILKNVNGSYKLRYQNELLDFSIGDLKKEDLPIQIKEVILNLASEDYWF